MPTLPKNPKTRQRRNTVVGAANLRAPENVEVPPLPEVPDGDEWSKMTQGFWADIWASPMSPEWDGSDLWGLYRLAQLHEDFWTAESRTGRIEASKELRLLAQRYGIDPFARRSLQWAIPKGEEAAELTDQRRAMRQARAKADRKGDPRRALAVVK